MSGILREEFERAFRNSRFLVVFLLSLACFAYGLYEASRFSQGFQPGTDASLKQNAYELWLFVHYRSFFLYLAPIAAALPFVDSLWVDRSQGFLRFILARTTYRRYLAAKVLANLTAGAVAVGGPLLLLYAYTNLTAARVLPDSSVMFTTWGGQNGSPLGLLAGLYTQQPGAYILSLIALAGLFGAAYATLGLAVSSLVHNRYVALSTPFIVFVVGAYIADRARHLGHQWSPETILIPYNTAEVSAVTVLLQLTAILAASGLLLYAYGRRTRIVS
jgi:ABC-type transport system involved in multi-copper enzyme maturation permease subunit